MTNPPPVSEIDDLTRDLQRTWGEFLNRFVGQAAELALHADAQQLAEALRLMQAALATLGRTTKDQPRKG